MIVVAVVPAEEQMVHEVEVALSTKIEGVVEYLRVEAPRSMTK